MKTIILVCCISVGLFISANQPSFAQQSDLSNLINNYWHNKLSASLSLQKSQFKLAQLNESIGYTSLSIWKIFDAVPAGKESIMYDPSQYNSFFSNYSLLLHEAKTIDTIINCNLNSAMLNYGNANDVLSWNKPIDSLLQQLNTGPELNIKADTFFVNDVDKLDTTEISIEAHFKHIIIFSASPYRQPVIITDRSQSSVSWFTPCFLKAAYSNVNLSILSFENWQRAFGTNGYFTMVCKALVVIDSGSITTQTSNKQYHFSTTSNYGSIPVLLGVVVSPMQDFIRLF